MPHRMSGMPIRTSRVFLVVLAFQSVAAPSDFDELPSGLSLRVEDSRVAMGLTGRACPGPLFENPEYCVGQRPLGRACIRCRFCKRSANDLRIRVGPNVPMDLPLLLLRRTVLRKDGRSLILLCRPTHAIRSPR